MTEKEAKEELREIDSFCRLSCNSCVANDYYCPSECALLEKARKLDFDRIIKCYAKHDGDLTKVWAYIKATKLNRLRKGY